MPKQSPMDRLFSSQSQWDNTMADSCARALERDPGSLVVHVNGGFHSEYKEGAVAQLLKRRPEARVATVAIIPADDIHWILPESDRARAEFLVYAEHRARDLSNGTHGVVTPGELRYLFDKPHAATDSARVPLLVWLSDDGARARDSQSQWRAALGDEAALAVVEAPYLETEEDLRLGGRWSFSETFEDDQGRVLEGLERLWEYVVRRYPVDPERVVIAGEGAGATCVLSSALYTRRLPAAAVAISPRQLGKLREQALPDTAPATKRLTIVRDASGSEALEEHAEACTHVGLDVALLTLPVNEPARRWTSENAVRVALGLPERSFEDAMAKAPYTILVLDEDTPLARAWGDAYARALENRGGVAAVVTAGELERAIAALPAGARRLRVKPLRFGGAPPEVGATAVSVERLPAFTAKDLADGKALPLAPGPFGGTTVLVVPAGLTDEDRAAWRALEDTKAIQSRSRIAALRIVFADAEPGLDRVLDEVRESGRSSVLIAPAAYCAAPDDMRRLRSEVEKRARGLEITFLPGLGGELVPPSE